MRCCGVGPVGDCRYTTPVTGRVLVALHGVGTRECLPAGTHEGTLARVASLVNTQVVASREGGATLFTGKRLQRPSATTTGAVTGTVALVMTIAAAATVSMVIRRRSFYAGVVGYVSD